MKNLNIDKSKVALRFAQAGQSYTEHAVVQKQITQHLFDLIGKYCPEIFGKHLENVLEIGCGSGNLTHLLIKKLQIKHLILNDLYSEIQQHFLNCQNVDYLIGDIEQLKLPQYLTLVASSSALQWIIDLDGLLKKIHHNLKPQGLLCFSTFGQQNLQQIKYLTGQGLEYLSLENIQEKLQQLGFEVLHISEQTQVLNFEHPKQILQHLKATGVTATASNFRWTKHSLQDFYLNYQQFLTQDELGKALYPLSYHPIYCIARRMP